MAGKAIVRVYHEARSAHLERLVDFMDGELLFVHKNYDFDARLDQLRLSRQVRPSEILRRLRKSPPRVVEINEAAYVKAWPTIFSVLLARCLLPRRRRFDVVFYALENGNPGTALASKLKVPDFVGRLLVSMVVGLIVRSTSRIAFGTDGALATYSRILRKRGMPPSIKVFTALDRPCASCDLAGPRDQVIFLGSFEDRKGVPELMDAWELASATGVNGQQLLMIGKGPLEVEVEIWAGQRSDATVLIDPDRSEIHAQLSRASVLVLYSQPTKTWREQVGLPLLEALSHGCKVVASDQTGIADWLRDHGHWVVGAQRGPELLAPALTEAILSSRFAASVTADLPPEDQRKLADYWMVSAQ